MPSAKTQTLVEFGHILAAVSAHCIMDTDGQILLVPVHPDGSTAKPVHHLVPPRQQDTKHLPPLVDWTSTLGQQLKECVHRHVLITINVDTMSG